MTNYPFSIAGCCLALTGVCFAQKVIPNHAIANLVLGQSGFVTNAVSLTSSFSLNDPVSVAIDPVSGKVFVADDYRVLRYPDVASLTNGAGAEAVFGQPNFTLTASANGPQGMGYSDGGIFLDRKGRLWVADSGNHRVLCFEAAIYRSSHAHADRVFGQPDFTTTSSGTTTAKMHNPASAVVDSADRLWVSDYSNNRVLRFDSISTKANGANADGVLGQGVSSASQMNNPAGLAVSSTGTLFVAELSNNRVTRFNNAATLPNGAAATGVMGQPNFDTISMGITQSKLSGPVGIWLTPAGDLWVVDGDNNRVLRFNNAATIASGSPASGVVGQPNFTTSTAAITSRGIAPFFAWPTVDGAGNLWVADRGNVRVLRFPPDVTAPLITVTSTVPRKTTAKSIVIKGTASDTYGVTKVQFKLNSGSPKNVTGTTRWQFTASLKMGINTITIFVTDSVGNVGNRTLKIKRVSSQTAPHLLLSEN